MWVRVPPAPQFNSAIRENDPESTLSGFGVCVLGWTAWLGRWAGSDGRAEAGRAAVRRWRRDELPGSCTCRHAPSLNLGRSRRGGRGLPPQCVNLEFREAMLCPPMVRGRWELATEAGCPMINDAQAPGTSVVPRSVAARLRRRPPLDRRLLFLLMAGALVVVGLVVAWLGQRATAQPLSRPRIVWSLSPASNTVTIRLTPHAGASGRQVVAASHLVVTEHGTMHPRRTSPNGGRARIPVPPGRRTRLVVVVKGPQPFRRTLTVTTTTRRVRLPGGTGIRALPPSEVLLRCLVPCSDTTRWLSATT